MDFQGKRSSPVRTISASASIEKAGFEVVPINGYIGAEIRGIDLRRSLAPEQFRVIHNALVEHEVIVMRDQDITLEQQLAFGRLFGKLSIHPFSPNMKDKPEVIVLDYSADNPPALTDVWHSDETFRDIPPLGTILRARIVPTSGGDYPYSNRKAVGSRFHSRHATARRRSDAVKNDSVARCSRAFILRSANRRGRLQS